MHEPSQAFGGTKIDVEFTKREEYSQRLFGDLFRNEEKSKIKGSTDAGIVEVTVGVALGVEGVVFVRFAEGGL